MDQPSEQSGDRSVEQDEGRWLTYPELSAVRGIDKPSAIRLATRKRWRRQRDNRRVVRVLVPPEWLSPRYHSTDQPMARNTDRSGDQAGFTVALAAVQAAHAGEVAALHGQVAGLKERVDDLTGRLAAAQVDAERARADAQDAQVDAERARADAQDAQVDAERAQKVSEELWAAEVARKGRGRWARLRAAWRGQ
jgi:hypothetical protein